MTLYIAVGFAAAAVLWLIIWSAKGLLLTPVRLGKNTDAELVLRIRGPEPAIEYTLRSLIWLRENGTLRAELTIKAAELDDETRSVLRRLATQYRCINLTEELIEDAGIKRN